MSYPIPEEIIDEVRRLCNIIDVIGEYISLEKKGKNFLGLCPFHGEKTPSFSVSEEKQLYYCFGCGAAGNVFGFVMKMEGLTFPEAVRYLARRAGVHIPAPEGLLRREKSLEDKLIAAHELAVRFYCYNLSNTAFGAKVTEYLGKRGITANTGEFFKLGYAPRGWDNFLKAAQKEGLTPEILLKAGLVSSREGGGYYDRFRDRLMFPIYNHRGRAVGFGGRVLPWGDQAGPKYLNSPETLVFNKSMLLYGFHLARPYIRRAGSAVIVEGYTDVIAAYQAGFKNVVASLGTSLTAGQGKQLRSQAKEMLIAYDADAAGQSATWRGFNLLQDLGCTVKVVELPAGSDPDSFIHQNGASVFGRLVEQARPVVEYRLNRLQAQQDLSTREGLLNYLEGALPVLASVPGPAEREIYLKLVAEVLGISETALRDELKQYRRQPGQRRDDGHNITLKDQTNNINQIKVDPAEKMLLALMLVDNQVISLVREKLQLDDFSSSRLRQVVELIWQMDTAGSMISGEGIINYFSDLQIQQLIIEAVMDDSLSNLPPEMAGRMAGDCIDKIKSRQLSRRWGELKSKLKVIEGQGLNGQARDLLRDQWVKLVRIKEGPCRSGEGEDY